MELPIPLETFQNIRGVIGSHTSKTHRHDNGQINKTKQ